MHAPRRDFKDLLKVHAAPGEPFVWFTSMGLGIGLLMVAGLLGVIVMNGLPVFWPGRAVAVKLKENIPSPVPNSSEIVGEIVQERTKSVKVLGADGEPAADQKEIQLFVGNKDTYGFSFVFLDSSSIGSIGRPRNMLVLERVEYGDAFGTPVGLQFADGQRIEAGSVGFDSALQELIRDGNARRAKIEKIERIEIGHINSQMTELRVKGRDSAESQKQIAELDEKYNVLASEAKTLRLKQTENQIVLRLPNDVEKSIAIGNIIFAYYPNQLGFLSRLGIFLHNIWGFLTLDPREANTEGGVFPAIFGTFVMTLLMSIAVMPFGVVAAIYLRDTHLKGYSSGPCESLSTIWPECPQLSSASLASAFSSISWEGLSISFSLETICQRRPSAPEASYGPLLPWRS